MNQPVPGNPKANSDSDQSMTTGDPGLRSFADRLAKNLARDTLIQGTTDYLRNV